MPCLNWLKKATHYASVDPKEELDNAQSRLSFCVELSSLPSGVSNGYAAGCVLIRHQYLYCIS